MAVYTSDTEFEWGDRVLGTSSSYESMSYRGVQYRLHDCVFVDSRLPNPWVGKLMRLYEEEPGVRKVRIRWFFRPFELPLQVFTDARDVATSRELFIAVGAAKGTENDNEVGVILGKANVLCTARFSINPVPTQALIDDADHFFNRAYDVVKKKLVKMANVDSKVLAQRLINKMKWVQQTENEQVINQTTSSEGSTSSTTSKGVNLVRRKHFVSVPLELIGAKVKKKKRF